jgi:hypothetical protein
MSLGMLVDDGQVPEGGLESKLQTALRSKFPDKQLSAPPARQAAAYPQLKFTVDDVTSMDGAFGSRMPKLKAAGLDGWRLEHTLRFWCWVWGCARTRLSRTSALG